MITIHLPESLRRFYQSQTELQLAASKLNDIPSALKEKAPQIYAAIFHQGELTGFVNFYINESLIEDILHDQRLINPNDKIEIITSISGG